MTWAFKFLGTKVKASTTAAVTISYPASGINAGDTIFLRCATGQASDTWTVSDANSKSVVSRTANGSVQIWRKVADGTENGGTFTVTCSSNYGAFYNTAYFSGGPSDANFASSTVSATAPGAGTQLQIAGLTIPNPNCLVLALSTKIANGTGITAPGAWIMLDQDAGTAPDCCAWAYQIQTTATNIASNTFFTIGAGDVSAAQSAITAAIQPGLSFVPYPPMSLGGIGAQMCQ